MSTNGSETGMAVVEQVVMTGDLSRLDPGARLAYYKAVCESVGLNPLTRPFEYLSLNGRLVLYARRDCTEQLRRRDGVSITKLERELVEGIYTVTAYAANKDGRTDTSIGAVPLEGLKGESRANAMMKCETKAKRRVTLSMCGLGLLDETETESIPGARRIDVDPTTGEVLDGKPAEDNPYLPKEKTGVGGAIPPSPVDVPGTVVQRPDQAGDAQPPKRGPGRPRKTTDVAGSTPAGASTVAGFESPQGERGVDPAETAVSGAAGRAPISSTSAPEWIEFTLGEGTFMRSYRTRGMTAVQMAESHKLLKQVDTLCGKGTARAILAKQMNVQVEDATRNALTEAEADKFLAALRATLGETT